MKIKDYKIRKINTPDFVKGMFYTNGEEYFCKSSNGIYYYSYLSHSWIGPINENNEWQFYERYSALKNNKKSVITENQAKEECVKKDLRLLEDFKTNHTFYYKLSSNLFVKQIPDSGMILYYEYKKGWKKFIVSEENHRNFLDNLTLISFIKLKSEADKEIELIEKTHNKKALDEINILNSTHLKNIPVYYSYNYVFYKDDDKNGWKVATLPGSTLFAELLCAKYKIEKGWKDYQIFYGGTQIDKPTTNWNPTLDPYLIHITSNWLYNKDTKRWFILPEEKLPRPIQPTPKVENIEFNAAYTEPDDDLSNSCFDVEIKTGKQICNACIQYPMMKKDFKKFFNDVKTKDYAQLIIEEISKIKWFAWKLENNTIRFQIQNWESKTQDIDFAIDIEIEKDKFLETMKKFEEEIDSKEEVYLKKR